MSARESIRRSQEQWFGRIKPFLLTTNLNVGSGHGFFSDLAAREGIPMTSLEVAVPPDAVNAAEVILYDGSRIPFDEGKFELSLAMYVLHHTRDPEALFKEMSRVAAKRIVIVDELYRNPLGKIYLAILDFVTNRSAGLDSEIHWNSYLTSQRLERMARSNGWKIVHQGALSIRGLFDEVVWVFDKQPLYDN